MKTTQCLEYLAENKQRIRQMVDRVSLEQARWRPEPESWSILEVINHLLDEERSYFRYLSISHFTVLLSAGQP